MTGSELSGPRQKSHFLKLLLPFILLVSGAGALSGADRNPAFNGRIDIVITRGTETTPLLYTIGENVLRIEVTGSNWPNPNDIVDLKSGELTLVYPHNRSFMRLRSVAGDAGPGPRSSTAATTPSGAPQIPTPPPGIDPQPNKSSLDAPPRPPPPGGLPPGIGPPSQGTAGVPNIASMPAMPMPPSPGFGAPGMMPPMPMEKAELKAAGKKETILGYECEQFEVKQRGETMEIWATDKLLPFQPYVRNQPHRFGPRMIEEQWSEMLTAKKLFPLRAILRLENGPERYRFEVKSITPEKIGDKDGKLFQPPEGYSEVQPLPF